MRSHACRLRRLWRVTSSGGPADTVGLASGQRGRDGASVSL